jgi:hypothetical protein
MKASRFYMRGFLYFICKRKSLTFVRLSQGEFKSFKFNEQRSGSDYCEFMSESAALDRRRFLDEAVGANSLYCNTKAAALASGCFLRRI